MWLFNGEPFTNPSKEYEGFVYIVTNNVTGRKYIGKKSFWSRRKLKKSDKRKTTVESDWQRYYGSSDLIKEDVKKYGKESFTREVLILCQHKKSMSYYETMLQFLLNVLLTNNFYNDNILGKFYMSESNRIYSKVVKSNKVKEFLNEN